MERVEKENGTMERCGMKEVAGGIGTAETGERVRSLRREAGLTQAQLGEKLGVSAQVVSNWERGVTPIYAHNIIGMAELYDCSMDYVIGMSDDRTRRWA